MLLFFYSVKLQLAIATHKASSSLFCDFFPENEEEFFMDMNTEDSNTSNTTVLPKGALVLYLNG